jgi:phage tail tape-measure protein
MKFITTIMLTLLAGLLLSSCDKIPGTQAPPSAVDPVTVLEDQVASERELREKAEAKAEEEAGSRGAWQLAALGLSVITVVAFVGGTAIGSRGKRHADTTP